MSAFCAACGKDIEPDAQFCLHCGAPTAGGVEPVRAVARPRREFRVRVPRRFWVAVFALVAIAAAGAAFWFRSFLGPAAPVVGQWSGAVASIPPDAGPYANAGSVDVSISRVGQGGSLIGTIEIGAASAPLSGRIHGHHVSLAADFSPASVDAPHPRFVAEGTVDGDSIETRASFKIGADTTAGVLIDEPITLLRGAKRRTAQAVPTPAESRIVPTLSPTVSDVQTAAPAPVPPPVSASAAVDTVRTYYRLWNLGDFPTMYGMLSTRMQIKNPYVQYVKYHSLVTQITVDAYQDADPSSVAVRIVSRDRERDGRITENVNAGHWYLIWDGNQWKLDRQDVHDVK